MTISKDDRRRLTACAAEPGYPEPETLFDRIGTGWAHVVVRLDKDPAELLSRSKAFIVRGGRGHRIVDLVLWNVLGGGAAWPMANVCNLSLPHWLWSWRYRCRALPA